MMLLRSSQSKHLPSAKHTEYLDHMRRNNCGVWAITTAAIHIRQNFAASKTSPSLHNLAATKNPCCHKKTQMHLCKACTDDDGLPRNTTPPLGPCWFDTSTVWPSLAIIHARGWALGKKNTTKKMSGYGRVNAPWFGSVARCSLPGTFVLDN